MDKPTIEIEGTEYPFSMGRGALNAFAFETDRLDMKIQELDKVLLNGTLKDQLLLNYFCLKVPSKEEGIDFDFSFDEFTEAIKENPHLLDRMDKITEAQMPAQSGNPKKGKGKS